MKEESAPKFLCEQSLSWFIGLFGCCGLFYFATISGAGTSHPIILASAFGAIYFFVKIIALAKTTLLSRYPSLNTAPKNPEVRVNQSKLFGPALLTILFGPVLAWLLLVLFNPSSEVGKLAIMSVGMAIFFGASFLWSNKKT